MAARKLGMTHTTLDEWVKGRHVTETAQEIRTEKKIELRLRFENLLHELADVLPEKRATANLRDVATAMGILTDKMQLLKGEATSITKDATARTNDERAARILSIVKPTGT